MRRTIEDFGTRLWGVFLRWRRYGFLLAGPCLRRAIGIICIRTDDVRRG
jgi:hypothetical protein